jgi:8-oxo-dGTP pyrophosphatase MutT (NUDIX family)
MRYRLSMMFHHLHIKGSKRVSLSWPSVRSAYVMNILFCGAITTAAFFVCTTQLLHPSISNGFNTRAQCSDCLNVYELRPGVDHPNQHDEVNIWKTLRLLPGEEPSLLSIDEIHRRGLFHSGTWITVVDDQRRILLLKRAPHLVTCPNAWSLLGEHASPNDETPLETAKRGIREEVGDSILSHVQFYKQLTNHPVFYYRDYGPSNGNRIDRQLTYLYYVQLDTTGIELVLDIDNEVADTRWISLQEIQDWIRAEERQAVIDGGLCDKTIVDLLRLTMELLQKELP